MLDRARFRRADDRDTNMDLHHPIRRGLTPCLLVLLALLAGCDDGARLSEAEYFQRAEAAFDQGDLATATIELKNALQQNPDSIGARWLLGRVYLGMGNGESAEKELLRALDLGMGAEGVMPLLGRALLLQYEYQRLLEEVRLDDAMAPATKALILSLYGQAHLGNKDIEQAETAFEAALAHTPDAVPALVGLVRVAQAQGDLERARGRLARALQIAPAEPEVLAAQGDIAFAAGDYPVAENAYRKLIDLRPAFAEPRLGLARALLAQERYDDGVAQLEPVLAAAPEHAEANYLRALAAYRTEDYEAARNRAEKVLNILSDGHPPSTLIAGAASLALGHMEQAYRYLTRVKAAVPGDERVNRLLAATQLNLGLAEEAARTLGTDAADGDAGARMLAAIGSSLVRAGDLAKGRDYLQRASAAAPENPDLRLMLGVTELALGDQEGGTRELEAAVAQAPDSLRAALVLVIHYLRGGDHDKALATVGQLAERLPDDPTVHNLLGVVQLRRQAHEQAGRAFRRVLELEPGSRVALFNLATLARQQGDLGAAAAHYETVLEGDPDDPAALRGLARLERLRGQPAQALGHLERAWEKHPDDLETGLALTQSYLENGQLLKALNLVRALQSRHPDHPAVLYALGRVQLAGDDIAGALGSLRTLSLRQPDQAAVWYWLATAQARNREPEAALESLARALELQPGFHAALIFRVELQAAVGDRSGALAGARALQRDLPGSPAGLLLEGDIHLAAGEHGQAVSAYRRALELENTPDLLRRLGAAERLAGRAEAAAEYYRRALERDPAQLESLLGMAELARERGQSAEALDWLERAWQAHADSPRVGALLVRGRLAAAQADQALALAQELRRLHPGHFGVGQALGDAQRASGDLAAAAETYAGLTELQPDSALAWNLLADARLRLGDYAAAAAALDRALAAQPDFAPALVTRARLELLEQRDQEAALATARSLQARYPDQDGGHLLEGEVYLRSGRFADAVVAFRAALAQTSRPGTVLRLATAQWSAGDREGAIGSLGEWLEAHPQQVPVRLELARMLVQAGRMEQAVTHYEKAAELDPGNIDALNNLAWYYQETGRPEALAIAERAAAAAPGRPEVADTLGWILVLNGQAERGLPHLEAAAAKLPQAAVRYHLAVAYSTVGRREEARRELERLLDEHGEFPERGDAISMLNKLGRDL